MFSNKDSQAGFLMGLAVGIAAISSIGFFVLLGDKLMGAGDGGTKQPTVNQAVNPSPTPTPTAADNGDITKIPPVSNDDHIRGDKNAKVTLIEYSDFQCPFCQKVLPTLEQVMDEYDGKVRLIYRHFPLSSIHPQAQLAAEASECAAEQGKFWEMHDLLFANQSALDSASLKSYAGKLGLKQAQFDSCLDGGKYTQKVTTQAAAAQASGITGTPGIYVGNQLVRGAYPFSTFQQLIDGQL